MHLRSDAAEPVRTIFGAIKYTRDCGITHRDLEPNLLFHCEPEGTSEIMVADFAMSHIVPDLHGHGDFRTSRFPRALLPMTWQIAAGYGMPVDVWAMVVITYLLLAGYAPFDRDTRGQEIEAIIAGDYCFEPEEYWSNVSDAAREFVNCCLTVDPDLRLTATEALQHPWLAAEVPHFV